MKWKPRRLFVVKRELKKSTKGSMRCGHLWRKLSEPNVTDLPSDPVVVGLRNPLRCCVLLKQRDVIITLMQLQRLNCARRTNLRCFKVKAFFVSSAAEKGTMRKRWSFSMCVQLVVSIFSYYHCSLESSWWSWLLMKFVSVVMVSEYAEHCMGEKLNFT